MGYRKTAGTLSWRAGSFASQVNYPAPKKEDLLSGMKEAALQLRHAFSRQFSLAFPAN
jgi:hypothetical protein